MNRPCHRSASRRAIRVALAAATLAAPASLTAQSTAHVAWTDTYQTIDGFGVSDAWRSDDIAIHPDRALIMDRLFKINGGAGFSILRHRIGPGFHTAPGVYDWNHQDIVGNAWTAQEALARDCERVWAAAWTPPKWMKSNLASNGGTLPPANYQTFANGLEAYFQKFKNDFDLTYYGISPQNEPGPKPWESCDWTPENLRNLIRDHVGPTLSTRVIAPEATRWTDSNSVDFWYAPIHADPAARAQVDILAGHAYGGNIDVTHAAYGKPVWLSEWSSDTSPEDLSIANGVEWAHRWWRLLVNSRVNSCHFWWGVNMNQDGNQQGLMSAAPGVAGVTVAKRLWTLGNIAKFVRPGWVRIGVEAEPAAGVHLMAFKRTSTGQFAVIAINRSGASHSLTLKFAGFTAGSVTPHRTSSTQNLVALASVSPGSGFTYTLPAATVTTFVGAGTAATPAVAGVRRVVSVKSGNALRSTGPADFANVDTAAYAGLSSQKWDVTAVETFGGETFYRLSPQNAPGMALRVDGVGDFENVVQRVWNNWESQKFRLIQIGSSGSNAVYKLRPKNNDLFEYVLRTEPTDTNVIVRPWSYWESQEWLILAP